MDAPAEEAPEALRCVTVGTSDAEEPPEHALARFVLPNRPVGGRYRLLLALARQYLGPEHVSEIPAPARDRATAILDGAGAREGSTATCPHWC
ncbi:hypothetical protein ACIQ6R_27015 [Streptomyces sp. NPDC096048]|uniref:hypothetical protein n=1 Tax=Streptomyces sp. NPDC096048 TaxID=3366072 RepID=UPI0037FF083A